MLLCHNVSSSHLWIPIETFCLNVGWSSVYKHSCLVMSPADGFKFGKTVYKQCCLKHLQLMFINPERNNVSKPLFVYKYSWIITPQADIYKCCKKYALMLVGALFINTVGL